MTEELHCPWCQVEISMFIGDKPKAGYAAIAICKACGHVQLIIGYGDFCVVQKPTYEDMHEWITKDSDREHSRKLQEQIHHELGQWG